jgi:hypothetical protein
MPLRQGLERTAAWFRERAPSHAESFSSAAVT